MKSILKDLYDGEIYPAEAIRPDSPEYKTLHEKIDIDVFTGFSHGMKPGLLLALELLAEDEAS